MNERLGLARGAGALAILILGLFLLSDARSAFAQDFDDNNNDQLRARVQRLERDLHDLQQEVYRGAGTGGAPRSLAPAPSADVPPAQAAPLTQRVSDLEESLQRLTGQIEELQHQNQVLQTKVDRLQRTIDFEQNNTPVATPNNQGLDNQDMSDTGTPAPGVPAASGTPRALAPGPSNLGSIPQNTPMPVPKPAMGGAGTPSQSQRVASLPPSTGGAAGGAQAEFDSAMALLRRAQYEAAQAAFRAFADAHPGDLHAPEALFWTGDIAYSARHDYASAARAFAELLKKYGKAGRAPEGMLKLGLSLLGLGQKQEGCATLAALPVKYANAAPALVARAAAERKRAACT